MSAIVAAAMSLRGQAPGAWEQFLLAVREHSALTAMEMVKCPPENLSRAQGMAQMMNEITTTLMNAPKIYEKMQQARKAS
jgi:hypothetical protein